MKKPAAGLVGEVVRAQLDNVTPLPARKAEDEPASKLSTIWADEIEIRLDTAGLIDGLLSSTAMTVVYGESGAGKTFVVIDMACHIAAGMAWRGLAVEQGNVIYVAAESPESVKRRVWAWKRHHKVERLPLLVVQSSIDLLNGDCDAVVAEVARVARAHGRVALVVIDTLSRSMMGNENSPDDMGRYVAACGRIREAADTHVLVVHHTGKDLAKGARGHSSLRAATDVELEVTKGESGGCIAVTKSRDEPSAARFGFKLEVVELGANPKGTMVTTCVAVEAGAPAASGHDRKPARLTDKGKIVLQAVQTALKYSAQVPPSHQETSGVTQAVTMPIARNNWRQIIEWEGLSDSERAKSRQDWKRGVENVVAAKAVKKWGEWLWLYS